MATVWAHRSNTGRWESDAQSTGWSHRIEFETLSQLLKKLTSLKPSISGQISKLAIVAHGNTDGLVQLERDLTAATAEGFGPEFFQLNQLLASYARVIFFSCIAGKGEAGSKLLNLLSSRFFPHRYVIGFEVFGGIAPGGASNYPGDVSAVLSEPISPKVVEYVPAGPGTMSTRMSEYSWFAKWSLDGRIIRKSVNDQGRAEKRELKAVGTAGAAAAIRSHGVHVTFVAIEGERIRAKVPELNHPLVIRKVKLVSRRELSSLAGTDRHQGIVVAWTAYVYNYRCADPKCLGHSDQWHFCRPFVEGLPNGPLK